MYAQLAAQLRGCDLAACDSTYCILLELGAKQPPTIGPMRLLLRGCTPLRMTENISSETVSRNRGAEQIYDGHFRLSNPKKGDPAPAGR